MGLNLANASDHSTTMARLPRSGQLGLNFLILCLLTLTTAIYPLIMEIDPWHGHIVVGGSNPADRILALLSHRSTLRASHSRDVGLSADEPVVLSVVERAMLSSLSDFASETALVPGHSIPILTLILTPPLGFLALPRIKETGLAPPSPPPRLFS